MGGRALVSDRIGPYELIARLASGGMAEIHLAKRIGAGGFERAVVIKRALPHLAFDPDLRLALLDEARIMARIRHPNVVAVHELGEDGQSFYLVMEFLRGESLSGVVRALLALRRPIERAIAVHIVSEMLVGLHVAHELHDEDGTALHVVHRDVSPQNVFLTFDGEVKLLDFGIARFDDRGASTKAGVTKGKFAYMAPEQFGGVCVDRRADVFSAGVVLHELLTGQRLFARETEMQVLQAILLDRIPAPSESVSGLPASLDRICMRALARDPSERWSSAEAMRSALHSLMPALDPEQQARASLSALLYAALPDRLAETRELMRRARDDGRPPTDEMVRPRFPGSPRELDDTLPELVYGDASGPVDRGSRENDSDLPTNASRPRSKSRAAVRGPRRWLATAVATVSIFALAAALGLAFVAPSLARPSTDRSSAIPAPSPRRYVRLRVESVPAGARVELDGHEAGVTPCDLALDRGTSPVRIAIERVGYGRVVDSIVPEIDQRFRVQLAPAPTSVLPSAPPQSSSADLD